MDTPKVLLQNKQSGNSNNKQKEKINENSLEQNKNNYDSASPLTKKPSQNSNFKILAKNEATNNNENDVQNSSNTIRSYSSVVGTNDSNNTSNRIVIKAPLKETKQDEKQDQEDIIEEIDPFIIERLEDDNDRMFILRLEYEMTNLIKNKKESDIEYPNMNSYQRLIIHKIANYFKLCHINDRNNSSVIVIKTVASRIPKKKFYDIIAKPEDSNESETGNTEIKIMKRNDKKPITTTNNNKIVMKKKSNEHNIKKKNVSLEERKLAYDLARARIFDEADQNSNNNSKPKTPKENKQNIQKRVDVEEDDDKDVYNRSNFIIKPQTPDYNMPQYFNQPYNQSPNMMSQQKFQQSPYQKKFQKPMMNPHLQQNPLMGQNPLMNQQQSSPNNLMNNNLSYSSPFHSNNNNNSHSYSNIRNYSNFNPYNNVGATSGNNSLMSNPIMNNKNNSNVPLNDFYPNNTNTFQNFTSPSQTPTKEHNASSFNNSPISFQNDKKFMFSNSPILNNGNNNNNNNNNVWSSNKDFNFKNEHNVFNGKDDFENKGMPSFQTPSIYNNSLSSTIPSSNYKKPIGMNNNEMNSIDSVKNNTSFSKLNPNSEIFIPNAKNNKLSINDPPISNMNTPLNVNVPEFNPYNHNRPSSSTSSFSNNNKNNGGNPNLFDPTRPTNNTNNYYGGIGNNNNKPQFMNYSNYNQNNSNKSNFFN